MRRLQRLGMSDEPWVANAPSVIRPRQLLQQVAEILGVG